MLCWVHVESIMSHWHMRLLISCGLPVCECRGNKSKKINASMCTHWQLCAEWRQNKGTEPCFWLPENTVSDGAVFTRARWHGVYYIQNNQKQNKKIINQNITDDQSLKCTHANTDFPVSSGLRTVNGLGSTPTVLGINSLHEHKSEWIPLAGSPQHHHNNC